MTGEWTDLEIVLSMVVIWLLMGYGYLWYLFRRKQKKFEADEPLNARYLELLSELKGPSVRGRSEDSACAAETQSFRRV